MSFSVTILGSSGALPAYDRHPTSQYIQCDKLHILVDAGEGVQRQMATFGVSPFKLTHIFVSHLHGDHYLGLMGLLFSLHLNSRTQPIHLYAFRGLQEIITLQLKHARSALRFPIIFHEIIPDQKGILLEEGSLTVETFPLLHRIPTAGFRFTRKEKFRRLDKSRLHPDMTPDQLQALRDGSDVVDLQGHILYRNSDFTLPDKGPVTYSYCSDTAPSEDVLQSVAGTTILYHEATFLSSERQKALESLHSTAAEAALTARSCGASRLLIGHFSARYEDLNELLNEARGIFPNTELALEGTTFELDHVTDN